MKNYETPSLVFVSVENTDVITNSIFFDSPTTEVKFDW